MESRNSHETSSQGGDGSSHSSERSKLTIPEKIVQAGKEAVRKTKNLGRQKGSRGRQSTNPLALAATRVYRESIKASKTVLHIVRLLHSHDCVLLPSHGNLLFDMASAMLKSQHAAK